MKAIKKMVIIISLAVLIPALVCGQTEKSNFAAYSVTINISGSGTVTPGSGQYSGFLDLEAIADEGYKFVGWSGDLGGTISPMPLVIGSAKNITATFVKEDAALYNIKTSYEGEGFVICNHEKVYDGTTVRFNAIPDAGYIFAQWRNFPEFGQETPIEIEIADSIEVVAIFLASSPKTYYIATDGNDDNDGSFEHPFQTIRKAYDKMNPGNVTYVMPGVYETGSKFLSGRSGESGNYIHIVAYDMKDKPVIKTGLELVNCSYIHLKGLIITKKQIKVYGEETHHNVYDQLEVHHVLHAQIAFNVADKTHDNLFINCDMHNNVLHSGSNADGIAMWGDNGTTNGPFNNTLKYCRSYFNNDDGFDVWWGGSNIRFVECWAFGNGKDSTFSDIEGDGNGYKLGQGKPSPILTNCLAVKNRNRGFDQNSNTGGSITILNCSAYENDDADFGFWESPKTSIIRNCVSYLGDVSISAADDKVNSWNFGNITITDADFLSVDYTELLRHRKPDGSLPDIDFMKLSAESQLINKGVEVGLPFNGPAPDLGAFESAESTDAVDEISTDDLSVLQSFPNPFSNQVSISYFLEDNANVSLTVVNISGQTVAVLLNERQSPGNYQLEWDGSSTSGDLLPNGIYLNVLQIGNAEKVYNKMILNR